MQHRANRACTMNGEKKNSTGQIFRSLRRDKYVFEKADPAQGDSKTMEIACTRK
jgi:hypothetical protein